MVHFVGLLVNIVVLLSGASLFAARAQDATEAVGDADPDPTLAPWTLEDRRALAALAKSLPIHGVTALKTPALSADDASWREVAEKLIAVFAPSTMKRRERTELLGIRPFAPAVNALVPRHQRYRALQALLLRLSEQMSTPFEKIPTSRYRVRAGVTSPEVALLRERLLIEGFGAADVEGRQREYFDPRLRRALQAWQRAHGLPLTTVLDAKTLSVLNAPVSQPLADIALALARFRSLAWRRDDGAQVIVHINLFQLVAERDGREELKMPVVVGRATDRDQTPHLSTRLTMVIVNPSWVVPRRIVDESLRPRVQDLPDVLIGEGFDVSVAESGAWRVRMPPGPDNPLGRMKFILEDTQAIYLHDTNARSAFSRDARSLSHGCVRLSDPHALAAWLLPTRSAALDDALGNPLSSKTFDTGGVATHLMYQTVAAVDGKLVRFPDIYGLDEAALNGFDTASLARALQQFSPRDLD